MPPGTKRHAAQIRRELEREKEELDRRQRAAPSADHWEAAREVAVVVRALESELADAEAGEEERRQRPVRWGVVWSAIAAITSAAAAGAAWRAVSVSVDSSRLDQRAWVSFKSAGEPGGTYVPGQAFTASVHLANTGRTPAFKVSVHSALAVRRADEPLTLHGEDVLVGPSSNPAILFPGEELPFEVKLPIPERFLTAPFDRRVVFRGRVTYSDTFGRDHFTEACLWSFLPVGSDAITGFDRCPVGNTTDDAVNGR